MRYAINYVNGTHGHFLEFMCNKFIEGMDLPDSPFNSRNTSDDLIDKSSRIWAAEHFYQHNDIWPGPDTQTVLITYEEKDLLFVIATALSRAGEVDGKLETLHLDTYNKLNNTIRTNLLERLVELHNDSGLYSTALSPSNPDCPKFILREFFKDHQFTNQSDWIREMYYLTGDTSFEYLWPDYKHKKQKVYFNYLKVNFRDFYNYDKFRAMMYSIARFVKKTFHEPANLKQIHNTFMSNNPYTFIEHKTANIIYAILNGQNMSLSNVNVLQEAFIEWAFSDVYFEPRDNWFTNTKELREYIDERRR